MAVDTHSSGASATSNRPGVAKRRTLAGAIGEVFSGYWASLRWTITLIPAVAHGNRVSRSPPTAFGLAHDNAIWVGALAGLFKRLHAEAENDAAVEDFNLTTARLWQTPVLSGLAG